MRVKMIKDSLREIRSAHSIKSVVNKVPNIKSALGKSKVSLDCSNSNHEIDELDSDGSGVVTFKTKIAVDDEVMTDRSKLTDRSVEVQLEKINCD